MADYVLSNKADADLDGIYVYSYRTFGEAKADVYFLGLCDGLKRLAANPRHGRSLDHVWPGLFCDRCARHIIFYTIEEDGIFVVRILHDSMDASRHIDLEEMDSN
ncbi:MAG: type II toxin-antitoxin system RelE/ParE family toxin [Alphaproteobacteria bacterium]|nr:type II toxin-antitoxin system RelE/ParE family toxin [Alphaproteobacteria bacterium]